MAIKQVCAGIGVLITPHCHGESGPAEVQALLTAKDHGRCHFEQGRLKPPRPIHHQPRSDPS